MPVTIKKTQNTIKHKKTPGSGAKESIRHAAGSSTENKSRRAKTEVAISPLAFVFAGILFADGSIYAFITFAAAIIHELGHLAAALIARIPIRRISVLPLGAVISLGEPCPYSTDIAVKLAGGVSNLLAAGACAFVRCSAKLSGTADVAAVYFIICCIAFAAFNLLPIRTLDGGEALFSLLCIKLGPDAAGQVMRTVSLAVLFPVWIISGWILFNTGKNLTLLLICGWLFISAVLESGISEK